MWTLSPCFPGVNPVILPVKNTGPPGGCGCKNVIVPCTSPSAPLERRIATAFSGVGAC